MTDSGWMLYKRLLGYVKPHWRAFALAVVGFVIYAASSTALAEMMKRLIDGIQNPEDLGISKPETRVPQNFRADSVAICA